MAPSATSSRSSPAPPPTEWSYAWFTSAGELADPYTHSVTDPAKLTAPGEGPLLVWLVVRDLRGGLAWSTGALSAGG